MFDPKQPKMISTPCPQCSRRIGLMTGLKACTPFAIKCPHCKTTLAVRMRGMIPLVVAVTALITLFIGATVPIFAAFGAFWTGLYIVLLLVGWLALEIAAGVLFFTYASFVPINRNKRDKRAKEIL